MTVEEFLRQLAGTPRDWRLVGSKIRRGRPSDLDCPITAVARIMNPGGINGDGRGLPLDDHAVCTLVAAADNLENADQSLRMDLLEACGLHRH
jgi:hypothetical protein